MSSLLRIKSASEGYKVGKGRRGFLTEIEKSEELVTVSGLSVACTRLPSKRKRTELGALPCLSQKASINFFRAVVRLILKNTSLLLSVTLMLRCSVTWPSGFSGAPGLPLSSDPDMLGGGEVGLQDLVNKAIAES